jgi:hypothetical protein
MQDCKERGESWVVAAGIAGGDDPMISIILVTNRPGGLDVLRVGLDRQTYRDFELIHVDCLGRDLSTATVPFGSYMAALNKGVELSKGDVLLFITDYTYLGHNCLERHAAFHTAHDDSAVLLGGIDYHELPPLHPRFPLRYGWLELGHTDQRTQPPEWSDPATRMECYDRWLEAYQSDLADGTLSPFLFSTFAEPFSEPGPVFSSNDRMPPNNHLSLKNDSMKRSLLAKAGGFDERADGSHGHQDSITELHLLKAGATLYPDPLARAHIIDPHGIAIIRKMNRSDEDNLRLYNEVRG